MQADPGAAATLPDAFDPCRSVVVVAAHADDLETVCGGTVALLTARRVAVTLAVLTDGQIGSTQEGISREELAHRRRAEAQQGARLLGVREVVFCGRADGELVADLELRAAVAGVYRRAGADTVLSFDPWSSNQLHADHVAAGTVAVAAAMPARMPLYHPEQLTGGVLTAQIDRIYLFDPLRVDLVVDVAAVWESKVAAALCHASQFPHGRADLDWMERAAVWTWPRPIASWPSGRATRAGPASRPADTAEAVQHLVTACAGT
jgi:LmbE family N-acetylglucosaminyl deacetylase